MVRGMFYARLWVEEWGKGIADKGACDFSLVPTSTLTCTGTLHIRVP